MDKDDVRNALANERTFLAWVRTAVALVAGGLAAAELLGPQTPPMIRRLLGVGLVGLGGFAAVAGYLRWQDAIRALREDRPLSQTRIPQLMTAALILLVLIAAVLAAR